MPDGPETRIAVDRGHRAVGSSVVTLVFFAFGHLKPYEKKMRVRRIAAVEPRGKALLIRFDNERCIYSHNQLHGRWDRHAVGNATAFLAACRLRPRQRWYATAWVHDKPDYSKGTWGEMCRTSDKLPDPTRDKQPEEHFQMSKNYLPASLFAAALAAGGMAVSAHAGHGMSDKAHGQMSQFMAHHGFMRPDARKDEPAKLGVAISAISQADLDALSLEYGVRIQDVVEGSVAENAGIQAGDVVTEIDGRPAYSPERLQHLVAEAAGASTIALLRNKEPLRLQADFSSPEPGNAGGKAVLGIRIQEMTNELKEAFGTEGDAGVLVSQVLSGSAAQKGGLKAGDVIVSIGGGPISAVTDVHGVLGGYSPGETLDVAIVRDRQAKVMQIALGSASHAGQAHVIHPHHGQQGHGMRGYGKYGHGYRNMPWHGGGCHMGKGQRSS